MIRITPTYPRITFGHANPKQTAPGAKPETTPPRKGKPEAAPQETPKKKPLFKVVHLDPFEYIGGGGA